MRRHIADQALTRRKLLINENVNVVMSPVQHLRGNEMLTFETTTEMQVRITG